MDAARDAVKADHFAGHEEIRHLLAAVRTHDGALQKPKPHGIEIFKAVAGTKERIAALDAAPRRDEILKAFNFLER